MKRAAVLALAVLILSTSAVSASAEDWTQYRYDSAASGLNPDQAPIEANRWRVRWTKSDNDARDFTSYPLIVGESVYVGGYKLSEGTRVGVRLWSFDRQTGALNWSQGMPCGVFDQHLMHAAGTINVAILKDPQCIDDRSGDFFIDVATGKKTRRRSFPLWGASKLDEDTLATIPACALQPFEMSTRTYNGVFGTTCLPDEQRYSDMEQPLRIVNNEIWVMSDGTPHPHAPVVAEGVALIPANTYARGVPAVLRPTVVHWGQCGATACAVDISTHQVLWTDPVAGTDPLVHADIVYGACPEGLCARDLRTGSLVWSAPSGPIAPPIMAGGVLWVGSDATRGYDPATGAVLSRRPFTQSFGPAGAVQAVADGWMITQADDGIRAVTFDR